MNLAAADSDSLSADSSGDSVGNIIEVAQVK